MLNPLPLDDEQPPIYDATEAGRRHAARERERRRSTWWCRTNRKLFRRFGRYMLGVLMAAAGSTVLGIFSFLWFAILTPRRVSALESVHVVMRQEMAEDRRELSLTSEFATWLVSIKCGELQGNSEAFRTSALVCGKATERTRQLYPSIGVPRQ